jgi:hypothetical protein
MMRKLRTFFVALLLVPALISNASAFTAESDGALNPARPKSGWCYFVMNGQFYIYAC